MPRPTQPDPQERQPGRSFEHPERALGDELLERSSASPTDANEDFRSREAQADTGASGIAERAKAIAVMRKAEELMAMDNPRPGDEASLRRAFELAAGRVGLTIGEYHALVKNDPELIALERRVQEAARSRCGPNG